MFVWFVWSPCESPRSFLVDTSFMQTVFVHGLKLDLAAQLVDVDYSMLFLLLLKLRIVSLQMFVLLLLSLVMQALALKVIVHLKSHQLSLTAEFSVLIVVLLSFVGFLFQHFPLK